jgi:hypothetical protein
MVQDLETATHRIERTQERLESILDDIDSQSESMRPSETKEHDTKKFVKYQIDKDPIHDSLDWKIAENDQYIFLESKLKDWPLHVLISRKFDLTQPITWLPCADHSSNSLQFEIALLKKEKPSKNVPIIDMMLTTEPLPNNRHVTTIQTLFKEIDNQPSVLVVTITAAPKSYAAETRWWFGLEFNMHNRIKARTHSRGTAMVYTVERPTIAYELAHNSKKPWHVLRADKQLNVDTLVDLGPDALKRVSSNGEYMWRIAVVGYKADPRSCLSRHFARMFPGTSPE